MIAITFITVTMNSMKTVGALLRSFFANLHKDLQYEYIVIDNCSTDGTPEFIEKNYPGIKVVRNTTIKGFAANNNSGMAMSKGKVVALINPDIMFLPNAVEGALSFLDAHPEVGMLGPVLLNTDGTLQDTARRFLDVKTALLRLMTGGNDKIPLKAIQRYLKSYSHDCSTQYVDWIIGAVMFVRREAIAGVGGFDEKFFLYIEDQDWCYQMWQNGWKVAYSNQAKFIHNHQRASAKSFSKKTLWHVQSICYFLYKNYLLKRSTKKSVFQPT